MPVYTRIKKGKKDGSYKINIIKNKVIVMNCASKYKKKYRAIEFDLSNLKLINQFKTGYDFKLEI